MSNKRCANCGEQYSTTYKKCPFCGHSPQKRKGGKRLSRRRGSGGFRAVLLIIAVLLAVFLLYSVVKSIWDGAPLPTPTPSPSPAADVSPSPDVPPSDQPDEDGAVAPVVSGAEPTGGVQTSPSPTPGGSVGLTLQKTDISLFAVGETAQMRFTSSPSGTVTWKSSDESVATVSSSGLVRAAGAGTANVTASLDGKTATCIVRVKLTVQTGGTVSAGTQASLNKTDITFFTPGEHYTLKVSGTEEAVSWTSGNTQVAVVDQNGKVTAAGEGITTVRAVFGGMTLECIIRVKPQ